MEKIKFDYSKIMDKYGLHKPSNIEEVLYRVPYFLVKDVIIIEDIKSLIDKERLEENEKIDENQINWYDLKIEHEFFLFKLNDNLFFASQTGYGYMRMLVAVDTNIDTIDKMIILLLKDLIEVG